MAFAFDIAAHVFILDQFYGCDHITGNTLLSYPTPMASHRQKSKFSCRGWGTTHPFLTLSPFPFPLSHGRNDNHKAMLGPDTMPAISPSSNYNCWHPT